MPRVSLNGSDTPAFSSYSLLSAYSADTSPETSSSGSLVMYEMAPANAERP